MKTSLNISNKLTMVSEMRNDSIFQILEYDNLEGADSLNTSMQLNFMKEAKVKLKQVRIILNDSSVKIESGALSYMKGNIEIKTKTGGIVGLGKKIFANKVTGESMFKPVFKGTGEMFLEPTFGHYTLLELDEEEIIVDDGMFYACEEGVEVSVAMQKSVSSMVFGNEGLYQTRLKGSGIILLEIPVPEKEILRCKIYKDSLKVDGNIAFLRTGNVEFTVEKSGTSLIGTALNGEGLLNVYRGIGEVWLAPTKSIYNELSEGGLRELSNTSESINTEV